MFGQNNRFEIINATGTNLYVSEFYYSKDSIKFYGMARIGKGQKGYINILENYIRVDIIALNDSTKDTLYVKSFSNIQIPGTPFIANITNNNINKLPKDLAIHPFLLIKTEVLQKIFTLNDPIDVKLINKNKIKGFIKSYDKDNIIIEDLDRKITIVPKKELEGIKICEPIFAIGAIIGFLHNCSYSDVSKSKYKIVRQVFLIKHNGTQEFVWKE